MQDIRGDPARDETKGPGALVIYRKNGRGVARLRTNVFEPGQSIRLGHFARITFAALRLALRKHLTDDKQCDAIARDVFESAVRAQRSGAAMAVIQEKRALDVAMGQLNVTDGIASDRMPRKTPLSTTTPQSPLGRK